MKRRIGVFLLVALVFVNSFSPCFASWAEDEIFLTAKNFISQLSVNRLINENIDDDITRAEFVAMIVRAINAEFVSSIDIPFADCQDSLFLSEINTARALGITNGVSETSFAPDGGVTPQVAAKILVSALGYSNIAQAKGGYPSAHMAIAVELDLFNNVELSDSLTVRDAYIIIYNMMYADAVVDYAVKDDSILSHGQGKYNLLSKTFGYKCITGVVNAVGAYAVDSKDAGTGTIKIGDTVLKYDGNTKDLLGYRVEAWYDDYEDKAYVISKVGNRSVTIDADDITTYGSRVLKTQNLSGKTKNYTLDSGFTFIMNGRAIIHSNSDFKFDDGCITLVDNDSDSDYDYVLCEKTEYFVISGVDSVNHVIYDENSSLGSIAYVNDSDYFYDITIDGIPSSFDELAPDMVCRIYISNDKKVCIVEAQTGIVEGVVSEVNNEIIVMAENTFVRSTYFDNLDITVSAGNTYKLYFVDDIAISIIPVNDAAMQYGYYINYTPGENGMADAKIKILTSANKQEVYAIKSKVVVDGTNIMSPKSDAFARLLLDNGVPKYQVIRYRISDSALTHIDFSEDTVSDWNVDRVKESYDYLEKYVSKQTVNFRNGIQFGIPNVPFREAVIFSVPKAMATQTDAPVEYDDELFSVISPSELVNNTDYVVDAYDYSKSYAPGVITIYNRVSVVGTSAPDQTAESYLVYGLADAINGEGENSKLLKVYGNGQYGQYYMSLEVYESLEDSGKVPTPGDIVRFTLNSDGEIGYVAIDVDYDAVTGGCRINHGIDNLSTSGREYLQFFSGTALTQPQTYMTIVPDSVPSDVISNNLVTLCLGSEAYILFDAKTNTVKKIDKNSVVGAGVTGSIDTASYVICKTSYYRVNTVYVYINREV